MRAVSVRCLSALCAAVLCLWRPCRPQRRLPPRQAKSTRRSPKPWTTYAASRTQRPGNRSATTTAPSAATGSATSLAAAGVSAADVRGAAPGSPEPAGLPLRRLRLGILGRRSRGTFTAVANYERAILVAHAAGLDPARLSPQTPTCRRRSPDAGTRSLGSFGEPSTTNTVFGILAMKTTGAPGLGARPRASPSCASNQHDDGGWTYSAALDPGGQGGTERTGHDRGRDRRALRSRRTAPTTPRSPPALEYLQGLLVDSTGAIHYAFGDNADANGWVGQRPHRLRDRPPVASLDDARRARRRSTTCSPCRFRPVSKPAASATRTRSEANLYSTQDALRAIAGGVFTAEPPARVDPSQPSVRAVPSVAAGTPVPAPAGDRAARPATCGCAR